MHQIRDLLPFITNANCSRPEVECWVRDGFVDYKAGPVAVITLTLADSEEEAALSFPGGWWPPATKEESNV